MSGSNHPFQIDESLQSQPQATSNGHDPYQTAGPADSQSSMASHAPGSQGDISYPNPNIQNDPYIYLAVYSSVPVYEMMVRGVGVMRRRSDSYMNATQILKVAGVEKGKRTKILEKDIVKGVHEKIQGGYGRYQGTWIPYERAYELASAFQVAHLLTPIFSYMPPPAPVSSTPTDYSVHVKELGLPPTDPSAQAAFLAEGGAIDVNGRSGRPRQSNESDSSMQAADPHQRNNSTPVYEFGKLRKANKTNPAAHAINEDPIRLERNRNLLKSVFALDLEPGVVPDFAQTLFPPDLDPDTPIDDSQHSALHWAAALARTSIVAGLVTFGADIHRGNATGETPLIRAVLVTNNADVDSFERLLSVLGPSVRTMDDMGRTVLHHVALVSGLPGREQAAKYYLECIFEYVARFEKGNFRELVDAQDENGDTALTLAASMGSKSIAKLLLDAGADDKKTNALGLGAGDYGLDGLGLEPSASSSTTVAQSAKTTLDLANTKAEETVKSFSDMVRTIMDEFQTQSKSKEDELGQLRAQVRTAADDLAAARRNEAMLQTRLSQAQLRRDRIRNLEQAIAEEDAFDWTGRSEIDGSPANHAAAGAAFEWRGPDSTLTHVPSDASVDFEPDPTPPSNDSDSKTLPHLMRLTMWYKRVLDLLEQRIKQLETSDADEERKLQKIVAEAVGVSVDKVDDMLDGLITSVNSDGPSLDMQRVQNFLQRARDGAYDTVQ